MQVQFQPRDDTLEKVYEMVERGKMPFISIITSYKYFYPEELSEKSVRRGIKRFDQFLTIGSDIVEKCDIKLDTIELRDSKISALFVESKLAFNVEKVETKNSFPRKNQ